MPKTISFSPFSSASIEQAIREIEEYKMEILRKTELLRERIAVRLAAYVSAGFQSSVPDTRINGSPPSPRVEVSIETGGDVTAIIATGEDAVWIEFGAGVYYNTAPGTSPHPKGSELGFVIGGYGKGNGLRETWGYIDESGELVLTHGTPAAMPMYKAMQKIVAECVTIAQEVFQS